MEKDPGEHKMTPQGIISEEHVKKSLLADKGEDAQLVSWEVIDFTKKGDNYMSVVTSVSVIYSRKGQEDKVSYVVKLNPCRGIETFEKLNALAFHKEASFLTILVPKLDSVLAEQGLKSLSVARCFHSSFEPKKEQLYLEDMRSKNYKMYDKRKGLDVAHASLVLKELAKLHSSSLLLEHKTQEPVENKHDFLSQEFFEVKSDTPMLTVIDSYITTAVEMLKTVGGYEKAIAWVEGLKLDLDYLLAEGMRGEGFNVVNHGDCWNNNVVFRYDNDGNPEDVILLDLQICRKASLAIDLNYFIYTSLTGETRKQHLKSLLNTYYESFRSVLEANGIPVPFNEAELVKEFHAKNSIGGFFCMVVVPVIMLESDDIPDLTGSSEEDMQRIMMELRAKTMANLTTNPIMKPRFLAMFDEFMEMGLIS